MAERVCTCADNTVNAKRAREIGIGKPYGRAFVEVVAADTAIREVTLRVAAPGRSPVEVRCGWTRDNVWALCPSTVDCDEDRLPTPGSSGTLYLSRALIERNHVAGRSKWPDELPAAPEYRALRIWPTSIQLRGVELATGTMTTGTIDLMDPDIAADGQTLALDGRPVTLELSQTGFFQFLAPWLSLDALKEATAMLGSHEGRRSGATASARDKARAWTQVAGWQEVLDAKHAPWTEDEVIARRLLDELVA